MRSTTPVGTSLLTVFDFVWERFTSRLEGITDDEYFWQPVANCWTIRPVANGVWAMDGGAPTYEGGGEFTTIAWRIAHLASTCLEGFAIRRFGHEGRAPLAGSVAELPIYLSATYGAWRSGMVAFPEERWHEALGPNFGPYADDANLDLALHVLDEVVHHGAEVGVLRDLYARMVR
jgi:hypothetical protein